MGQGVRGVRGESDGKLKGKKRKFFFFKQKTAYEIYQCDWSSDVCSSDLTKLCSAVSKSCNPPVKTVEYHRYQYRPSGKDIISIERCKYGIESEKHAA